MHALSVEIISQEEDRKQPSFNLENASYLLLLSNLVAKKEKEKEKSTQHAP